MEYTDATFTKVKARSAEEEHLGILGPTLRAEVRSAATSTSAAQMFDRSFDSNLVMGFDL